MHHLKKKLAITIAALLLSFGISASAMAETTDTPSAGSNSSQSTKTQEEKKKTEDAKRAQEAKAKLEKAKENKEASKAKLTEARLKVCKQREKKISSTMDNLNSHGQNQISLFNSVYEKTDSFYIASGKTLSNYSALTADVASKKALAQTALDQLKTAKANFKCTGEDPSGAGASFKANHVAAKDALIAYHKSVKAFVAAVKEITKTDKTEGSTR